MDYMLAITFPNPGPMPHIPPPKKASNTPSFEHKKQAGGKSLLPADVNYPFRF